MSAAGRAVVLMGMLEAGPVEYASSALSTSAGGASIPALTKPAGLEVGDVVFILEENTDNSAIVTTGGGGGAWSKSTAPVNTAGKYGVLHHRVIGQVDIDNDWSLSYSGGVVTAFRYHGYGANAVSVKSSNSTSTASMALTGFSKSVNSYGVLTFLAATGSPASPGVPTGFTQRQLISSGAERHVVADRNADYVDGSSVTWTALANGNTSCAFLVEVTGT